MEINVYNNSSDNRVVSKLLSEIKSTTCELVDPCDVQNPSFTLEYDESLFKANYCYIPKFCRYYYINKVSVIDGERIQIDCHVDVLMSFDVRSLNAIVARNSNNWNLYFNDSSFPVYQNGTVDTAPFPNGFNEEAFIFTIVGGN